MNYLFQSYYLAKVLISKSRISHPSSTKIALSKLGSKKISSSKISPGKIGSTEISPTKIGFPKVGSKEIGYIEISFPRSATRRSILISGLSSLHSFQTPTPCFKMDSCSSFAIVTHFHAPDPIAPPAANPRHGSLSFWLLSVSVWLRTPRFSKHQEKDCLSPFIGGLLSS